MFDYILFLKLACWVGLVWSSVVLSVKIYLFIYYLSPTGQLELLTRRHTINDCDFKFGKWITILLINIFALVAIK